MNHLFKVMPQHLNRIQVRTLTRPLQSLHFVFLQPFRGGFAGVFWIIVLLQKTKFASAWGHEQMAGHCPSGFFGRQQNSWFHLSQQVFQVLKQQNSPRSSHCHHHILLLVWCSFSEMLCYFYARCNGTHTFQKVKLLSHQSTEYFPKSLGDHQDVFWQNWDELLCSFCSAVVLVLELCHAGHFCPVSFLWWSHEHWP